MGSLIQAFERVARENAGRPAIWSRGEGRQITFLALAEESRRLAGALPLAPGAAAALATGNGISFVELFLALRFIDVPVVAMDAGLSDSEKAAVCRRLGVGTILHAGEEGEVVAPGVRCWRLAGIEPTSPPSGTALVKLTSGSTGEPLGACFTEEALLAGITQIGEGMELAAGDRVLVVIPLSHSYGFDNGVLSLAALGTPLVIEPSYYPAPVLTALLEGEISFFPVVPPLVRPLAGVVWPELPLRRVICAGGPLAREAARAFFMSSGRHVHQFYGATECGGITFERNPEEPGAEGTVGRPLPGVKVLLDPGDGRVHVRSSANYLGYLGRDFEASSPRVLVTGDSAEWTDGGRLRLTGRAAELLNVGGRKVAASVLEAALRAIPGVRDAAVVGVEDPSRGDRIVAFLVSDRTLDHRETASLGVREVRSLDRLPYTERGKLDRRRLRDLASAPRE
jgi:acyl-CoA synthetase (AMP-forming)/AMP-acid ligase II